MSPESWPVVACEPLTLPLLPGVHGNLWPSLIELCGVLPGCWTLVGGQMVLLHALQHEAALPRISFDLDVVVNARLAAQPIRRFVTAIEELDFVLDGFSPEGLGHRYIRDGVKIDVLAPEGLGERTPLATTPPAHTLQVPGGTQALARTELVPVRYGDVSGLVPRPSLLGAIIGKALAVGVDDAPKNQRIDLALLLSVVVDPFAMRAEFDKTDRRRLAKRSEMNDPSHEAWAALEPEAAARGSAALRILLS